MVYVDHAATSPMREQSLRAMTQVMASAPGNASSVHAAGQLARGLLEAARTDTATVLGCSPAEIVFTSGGTESDNIAVRGLLARSQVKRLVTTAIEHPALMETASDLAEQGVDVVIVGVDGDGQVDTDSLRSALRDGGVCSVMYANNEVGTIQPVPEIAVWCREAGVAFHTDAVQAPGLLSLDVTQLGVDALSISAHKFGGPKGVGVLYIRNGVDIAPVLTGGGQERGLRPGTENVAGAVALSVALSEADAQRPNHVERMALLRERLVDALAVQPRIALTGHSERRLANHASFTVAGINGETLLIDLDQAGIQCSSGSACAAGSSDISHVLTAMGCDAELARTAIRFTFGPETSEQDVDFIASTLLRLVEGLA